MNELTLLLVWLPGESLSPVLRRLDAVHEGDDESGETDQERQPSEPAQGQRRVVERVQCNPGYYGANCTICSNGSYCLGDGIMRLWCVDE